jgi:hypothetical protein
MTGTQWPADWRINAVKENLESPADMSLYEERGLTGMVELRVAQEMSRVLAAHDTTTPPTITPTTTTTTEGNKMQNDRPLKFIPARLDAANVLAALSKILSTKFDTIEAAATEITLADLDAGLAQTELSLDDRMRIKFQCAQMGIIGKGRPTSIARI